MARILIVDDEEYIRDLIKEVLSSQGHEFELAADGSAAIGILRKQMNRFYVTSAGLTAGGPKE